MDKLTAHEGKLRNGGFVRKNEDCIQNEIKGVFCSIKELRQKPRLVFAKNVLPGTVLA